MNVPETPCFLNKPSIVVQGLLCFGSSRFQINKSSHFLCSASHTTLALRPIPLPTLFFLLRNIFQPVFQFRFSNLICALQHRSRGTSKSLFLNRPLQLSHCNSVPVQYCLSVSERVCDHRKAEGAIEVLWSCLSSGRYNRIP